jgi:molecular chaperone HtpG
MVGQGTESARQTLEFQAEVKQLLNIVAHSLYTNKEVFLRELIANASDALDRLRLLSLTDASVLEDSPDLGIFIETDPAARTLTVSDNGIGMSYDEVVENIGTIARSGSARFMELYGGGADESKLDLIGRFGVGFYSVFMVADKVTLVTRRPNQEAGVMWESAGDGTYQITEVEKKERGTSVTLHLKESEPGNPDEDFLNQYTIERHVQRHCNFITYPVRMNFISEGPGRDAEGEIAEGEAQTTISCRTLNSIQPLWAKSQKEVGREEYRQFYRQQFHDWEEPAEVIHTRGEGAVEFTALLFIPSHAPHDLYTGGEHKGLQLYCKHVLVMNDCRELLPEYLRFVRGVVDSPDLPLNISREMLQHNSQLRIIRNHVEKKVLDAFKTTLAQDRKKYESLWAEFGKALKGGIFMDYRNTEKLQDLLVFESSGAAAGQKTTLREYVERMPEGQKIIYYAVGDSRALVERLPQTEVVRERGIEVLYFLDKVDEFLTQHLQEYAGKKLQSVSKGDLDLEDAGREEQKPEPQQAEGHAELLEFMRKQLGDRVKDVRISKRLKTSPVCLVSGEAGYSLNMERLMREANQPIFKTTRILEVNPDHAAIRAMSRMLKGGGDESKLTGSCQVLYDQALLIENDKIEDPIKFADTVAQLIVDAYG